MLPITRNLLAAFSALAALGGCVNTDPVGGNPSPEFGIAVGTGSAGVAVDVGGGPWAAPGTPNAAEINCMNRIHWRSGGSARLVRVIPTSDGMTIVEADGFRGISYTCWADKDGQVVNVLRDGGSGWF